LDVVKAHETNSCTNCYVTHTPCYSYEGIGSRTMKMHAMLNLAVKLKMPYVCRDGDFDTAGHASSNLAKLFGCSENAEQAQGEKAVTFSSLPATLMFKKAKLLNEDNMTTATLSVPLQDNTLYWLQDDCNDDKDIPHERFGASWRWFRDQFSHVREMDTKRQNVKCWTDPNKKRIALHIRRGDDPKMARGKDFATYKRILDALFDCTAHHKELCLKKEQAQIVVMAETPKTDPEMHLFNKAFSESTVNLLLGEQENDEAAATARLISDLDCMSTADVLVTSGGGFSAMAAALVKDSGVSLNWMSDSYREDMPNALHQYDTFASLNTTYSFEEDMSIPNAYWIKTSTEI